MGVSLQFFSIELDNEYKCNNVRACIDSKPHLLFVLWVLKRVGAEKHGSQGSRREIIQSP